MIERAEMKDDIELAGTAECFRAGQLKLTRYARQPSKRTRGLDMTQKDIDARYRKSIFQGRMDRIVTSIATNIQQTAACESLEWDRHRDLPEFSQRRFGKWRAPGAIQCRHPIIEVQPMTPRLPKPQLFLQFVRRKRRMQREKVLFHCKVRQYGREQHSSTTILFLQR